MKEIKAYKSISGRLYESREECESEERDKKFCGRIDEISDKIYYYGICMNGIAKGIIEYIDEIIEAWEKRGENEHNRH
jgi:hypothetical protein